MNIPHLTSDVYILKDLKYFGTSFIRTKKAVLKQDNGEGNF